MQPTEAGNIMTATDVNKGLGDCWDSLEAMELHKSRNALNEYLLKPLLDRLLAIMQEKGIAPPDPTDI